MKVPLLTRFPQERFNDDRYYKYVILKVIALGTSVLVGLFILSIIYLGYMQYKDKWLTRQEEFEGAMKSMFVCNDSDIVETAKLHKMCDEKRMILKRSPSEMALRDVICSVISCGENYMVSNLFDVALDCITEKTVKATVIVLGLYIVLSMLGVISITRGIFGRREEALNVNYLPYMYEMSQCNVQKCGIENGPRVRNTFSQCTDQ